MSCLKEGSEGRVMECSENELGEYRMEAEKRGAPGLVGSQKANRGVWVLGGMGSGLAILTLVSHEPGTWHCPGAPAFL